MENSNPYHPPESDLSATQQNIGYDDSSLFSPAGRIGRLRYFLISMGYSLIPMLVMVLAGTLVGVLNLNESVLSIFMIPVFIVYAVLAVFIMIKRIHDIGWSAWWLLLFFVPLASIVLALLLLFKPGSEGENRFGLPPKPGNNALLMAVAAVVIIVLIGILASIGIPAYQDYLASVAAAQ